MKMVGIVRTLGWSRTPRGDLERAGDELTEEDCLTTVESNLSQSTIVTHLARDVCAEHDARRPRQYQRTDRIRRSVQRHVRLERRLRQEVVHATVERSQHDRAQHERP